MFIVALYDIRGVTNTCTQVQRLRRYDKAWGSFNLAGRAHRMMSSADAGVCPVVRSRHSAGIASSRDAANFLYADDSTQHDDSRVYIKSPCRVVQHEPFSFEPTGTIALLASIGISSPAVLASLREHRREHLTHRSLSPCQRRMLTRQRARVRPFVLKCNPVLHVRQRMSRSARKAAHHHIARCDDARLTRERERDRPADV
jgi:hypothetical protein